MPLGRFLVHVGVERIASEVSEMFNVVERNRAFLRDERTPDVEVLEVIAERMTLPVEDRSTLRPAPSDACEHRGRTLQRAALHVVMEAAYAAQFLTAAGSARTAMDHLRHG